MLALTRMLTKWTGPDKTQVSSASPQQPISNGNSAAPAQTAPAAKANDQVALTTTSEARNPYNGAAPSFSKVKVDAYGKGKNGSLTEILINQGYTSKEIYSKGDDGKNMLDRVQAVNNLRSPNLIRIGQELTVPSKTAPEQAAQPEQTSTPQQSETPVAAPETEAAKPAVEPSAPQQAKPATPEQAAAEQEPKVNQVKIDKWGQGPNSSLDAILKGQGFSEKDIYLADANGDTLLKKIARANGLKDPSKIQAGRSLEVPNSMAALDQMNIPEAPKPEAKPPVVVEQAEAKPPVIVDQPETKPPVVVEKPEPTQPPADKDGEVTANMGMLLDGVKNKNFTREEFQYLNARSSRYAQMRARHSNDGYTNAELKDLGQMEQRYGVEFARLSKSDDIALPKFPAQSSNPDMAIQIKHYHESGPLFDRYSNGSASAEQALNQMVGQRTEARAAETK